MGDGEMAESEQIDGIQLNPGDQVLIPRKLTSKERFFLWLRNPLHKPPLEAREIWEAK